MTAFRRLRLPLAAVLVGCSAAGVGCLYLRSDKRAVFQEVAGDFREARVLEASSEGGHETRLVELVNHRGEAVSTAWVRRPAMLSANYRIAMVYSGANTGKKILELIPARADLVLVAPQYPYARPRTPPSYLTWPLDVRRAVFRGVAGGLLAVSFLEEAEGLDARRLLLVGASLGTPFAVLHAALDARVPRVLLVHGGGDFPLILRSIADRRGRPWRGRLEGWLAEAILDSFDPIHYIAEIAPREVLLIGARNDRYFPAASTLQLYERAGEPKRLLWTEGAHVASRRTAALDEVLRQLELYLAEDPQKQKGPRIHLGCAGHESRSSFPATTYSPTQLPSQYHRR